MGQYLKSANENFQIRLIEFKSRLKQKELEKIDMVKLESDFFFFYLNGFNDAIKLEGGIKNVGTK